jgi:glyoxylase-like metal-dependent hydrolase (beta-lactamase superfamily II)
VSDADAGQAVSTRSLGDVEVTLVSAGVLRAPNRLAARGRTPTGIEVDAGGRLVMGIVGMCVRTPDALVVVDPCWLPADQTVLGPGLLEPAADLADALGAAGIDPAGATHVVITHGHSDHFSGVALGHGDDARLRFANAEHVFPARDWQALAVDDPDEELLEQLGPAERAGRLRLVDGDVEVCPGVTVLAAPGETPGHQAVRVDGSAGRLYYLGDLVHVPLEFEEIDFVYSENRDDQALAAARRRLFPDASRDGRTVVYTHARFPAWGRLVPLGDESWRWEYA